MKRKVFYSQQDEGFEKFISKDFKFKDKEIKRYEVLQELEGEEKGSIIIFVYPTVGLCFAVKVSDKKILNPEHPMVQYYLNIKND